MSESYSFLYRRLQNQNEPFIQTTSGEYQSLQNWLKSFGYGEISLLCGSFNPLHDGHIEILNVLKRTQWQVFAEISIKHVSKPNVTEEVSYDRLLQFIGKYPVLVTASPLMIEKIGMLRRHMISNVSIAVGYDVMGKMLEMHGNDFISALAASFTIFPRDGMVLSYECLPINCEISSEPLIHRGLSSTKIRECK